MIALCHINLPAQDPNGLAAWYADLFGLTAAGPVVAGDQVLMVFEQGQPEPGSGNTHFGFRVEQAALVERMAERLGVPVEREPGYAAFKARDPEGYLFEVYWEPDPLRDGGAKDAHG